MNHTDLVKQVEDFLTSTEDSRMLSERDRDYKDNKQWTDQERAKLESRNQAAIVVNRVKPKVEGMKGLLVQRKTDPKAWPRTPKHTKAAEAVTDALRYVADNVDFDQVKLENAENVFVEGYGAIITEVEQTPNGNEVKVTAIPWDRYYYDFHSRRLDFADKQWDGIIIWLEKDIVRQLFNLTEEETEELLVEDYGDGGQETFDDRPMWVDRKRDRIRIAQHFQIKDSAWHMVYFCSTRFLTEPAVSPYLDEFNVPMNPIEAYAANIDRDNNRFGEVRYWIDLQDEINHRRSKFLHLNSTRQTAGRKGAIPDIPAMKREMSKADGHVEYNGEKGDWDVLPTGDMSDTQFTLYQDGKHEMDAVGFNAQLSGERQGDLSGRAISNLQQAAVNELASLYAGLTSLEKRVYRQIWFRIRQSWGKDKWIRVTDDQSNLKWVGINQQVTFQEILEEKINDESLEPNIRQDAAIILQRLSQTQPQKLQEITEVRNEVAQLDMDIIIETSVDSVNIQQEQFELMAKLAQTGNLSPEIIELSTLREKQKKRLIEGMQRQQQEANEQAQQIAQIEAGKTMAETKEKIAKAEKADAETQQTVVQTQLIAENPPEDTGVVI